MNKYFEKTDRTYNYDIFRMEPMPETPFKFREDDSFQSLIESIDKYGLLTPITVIPHKTKGGFYEVISGVRRLEACKRLGYTNISCMVCDRMTRDEALIFMVDSNLCNRDTILPSEKAAAYKIKLDAMKRQGYRSDLYEDETSATGLQKSTSIEAVANETGDSRETIRKYIRLTELTPELSQLVDDGRIAMKPAVELSYLTEQEQKAVYELFVSDEATPSHAQAIRLRKLSADNQLNESLISEILSEEKGNQKQNFKISMDRIPMNRIKKAMKYLPKISSVEDFMLKSFDYYCAYLERKFDRGDR